MSDNEFMKLFKHTRDEFVLVREEIADANKRMNNVMTTMDHLISDYDILVAEEAANAEKYNRLSDKIYEHDQEITKLKKLAKA
jgi:CDP-diacylglycerol pyrophosphatase